MYGQSPLDPGLIGTAVFKLDNKITHYERRVYGLYQLIGDIGGINQIILALFSILISIYTNKLYEFIAVSEFYKSKVRSRTNKSLYIENEMNQIKAPLSNRFDFES